MGSKVATCDMTDEDYDQINPDELELMDLKWYMEMIMKKIKKYMKRTGNDLLTISKTIGFDKFKAKCYNYNEFGYFVEECDKPRREYP